MKQINEAFNSRDVDRIVSFFAEDCTFLMARGPEPEGRRVHGKAAVRKVLGDRTTSTRSSPATALSRCGW
jgi:ketosteroid isomerase-like protein